MKRLLGSGCCPLCGLAVLHGCAGKQPPTVRNPPRSGRKSRSCPRRCGCAAAVPQRVEQAVPCRIPLAGVAETGHSARAGSGALFAPWDLARTSIPAMEAFWGTAAYGTKQGYAENLQPYPGSAGTRHSPCRTWPSIRHGIPAIATRNTALRVLPSLRRSSLKTDLPGEGFPSTISRTAPCGLARRLHLPRFP
jgi:hypothetical protein